MTTGPIPIQDLLEHADFVRGLARRLIHDPDRVHDAVQETWVAAIERPPKDPARARGWLGVVLRNFVRRAARDQGRRERRERGRPGPTSPSPTDLLLEREVALRSVVEAVLDLDEPYRRVVLFRFYEDLYPRQIAERLGLPVATVKSQLHRALDQLRGKLESRCGKQWAFTLATASGLGRNLTLASATAPKGLTVAKMAGALSTKLVLPAVALLLVLAGWLLFRTDGWLSPAGGKPSEPSPVEVTGGESARETLSKDGGSSDPAGGSRDSESPSPSEVGDPKTGGQPLRDPNGTDQSTFRIRGRVVSTTGVALDGARIILDQPGKPPIEVTADETGQFVFRGPELQGSIPLFAYHRTHHALGLPQGAFEPTATIELPRGERRDGLELVLVPGGRLQGQVVDADTGEPIPEAKVTARWTHLDVTWSDSSGPDGSYSIEGVYTDSDITLGASAAGYATSVLSDGVARKIFQLHPGEARSDLRIALRRAGRLEVLVIDASGAPVPECGVWISVIEPGSSAVEGMSGAAGESEKPPYRTDLDGKLTIEEAPADRFRLVARNGILPRAVSEELQIEPGTTEEVTLQLASGTKIYGVVFKDGRPLPGAWVESLGTLHHAQGTADEQGHYVLEGFAPGPYVLAAGDSRVRRQEAIPATKRIVVEPGMSELEVNFGDEEPSGTRVFGRVLRGAETLSNVSVQFLGRNVSDSRFMVATQSDAAGFYEFDALPPGSGLLLVMSRQGPIGGFDSNPIDVPAEGELERDVLIPTNRVSGQVDFGDLAPESEMAWIAWTRIRSGDPEGLVGHLLDQRSSVSTKLPDDGRFVIESLAPGRYVPFVTGVFRDASTPENVQGNLTRLQRFDAIDVDVDTILDLGRLVLSGEPDLLTIDVRGSDGSSPRASARVFEGGVEVPVRNAAFGGKLQFSLQPGRYDIEIYPDGYAAQRLDPIEMSQGKWPHVEATVELGGTLAVEVTASGAPVAGAAIDVRDAAGRWPLVSSDLIEKLFVLGGFRTNPAGRFQWDHLPAGEYRIRAGDREKRCTIQNGDVTTVRFD